VCVRARDGAPLCVWGGFGGRARAMAGDDVALDLDELYGPASEDLHNRLRDPRLSLDRIEDLVYEFAERWVRPNVRAGGLYASLRDSLYAGTGGAAGDDDEATIHLGWDDLMRRLSQHQRCLYRLRLALQGKGYVSGPLVDRLREASDCVHILPQYVKYAHLALNVVNGSTFVQGAPLPLSAQQEWAGGGPPTADRTPTVPAGAAQAAPAEDPQLKDCTNFQQCFLHLCEVLLGCGYRRADADFFERFRTRASGYPTLAYRPVVKIKDFVSDHVSHGLNFQVWKWATNPPTNLVRLIEYVQEHSVPEAPRLEEQCDLRSYEGDAVGRGAGVYDCRADFFYPYALRDAWPSMADAANALRQKLRGADAPAVRAPTERDVAVIHLQGAFPHDTMQETLEVMSPGALGAVWREADAWECARPAHEVAAPRLAALLAERLPPDAPDEPEAWGRSWIPAATDAPLREAGWREVRSPELAAALVRDDGALGAGNVEPLLCTGVGERTYVRAGGQVWVPLRTAPRRPRAHLAPDEARAALGDAAVTHESFVRAADGRHFRPHVGRTWRDCETPEFDQIFRCQRMTDHDCFFLYAYQGRLFFAVGEFDNHQNTLMIEGIGGSGKSTLMLVSQAYFPKHLQGIMSSNMQPQFGMAAVLRDNKSRVIYCNEVSDQLSVVQEEWQTTVSGEMGSYAVKNQQQPLECKAKAQHFWCGNGFPGGDGGSRSRFKNNQLQVSRRLAGVLFAHPILPRDGGILSRILTHRLGVLQRRMILAYFEFVRVTGEVDPMSTVDRDPPMLPPAFLEYYKRGARASNPVEAFLCDPEYVEKRDDKVMLFQQFRELYAAFRQRENLPREARLSEDQYRTPFMNHQIRVEYHAMWVDPDGVEHPRVTLISGLAPVVAAT
jgi:hypothetical protein